MDGVVRYPSYRDWFLDADYAPAYEAHRRSLQQLQWRHPGRWVLKYPKHLLSLDALLASYPDAVLIWTHRDPAAVVPSVMSLTSFMRASNTPDFDPVRFGREWVVIEELALHRVSPRATAIPGRTRHLDVDYRALMADPVGTVAHVVRTADVAFDDVSAPGGAAMARRPPAGQARRAPLHGRTTSASTPTACVSASRSTPAGSCDRRRTHPRHRRHRHDRERGSRCTSRPTTTSGGSRASPDAATRAKETYTAVATPPPTRALSTCGQLEAAGVTVRAGRPRRWPTSATCPTDFTYVVHLAWLRADLDHLEDTLRANVEGAGLVLQHCRHAKAALVMSGMGVYSANDDPWWAYSERDPIGRGATAYAPTSPACKLGLESVARFCARAFDLPVVITRLNTLTGLPGSFPAMHIDAVMQGRTMVAPSDPTPHTPIHIDDMKWMLEPLLDAASTTACITNWCGDDVTTVQDWMRDAAAWSGRDAQLVVEPVPGSPAGAAADPMRRRSITGPCRTTFADTFRTLFTDVTGIAPGPSRLSSGPGGR